MSWPKFVIFLLVGYLAHGRTFAYLGIPPLSLFIGEMALGAFLIMRPTEVFRRWGTALVQSTPLSGVAWVLYFYLAYGVFEVLRGLNAGYNPIIALQNLAFNYYALFFFVGLWAGVQNPQLLGRVVRWLAWWNALYGTAYVLVLSRTGLSMPGFPDVNLFGQPGGSVAALLGLLAFERSLIRVWPLLLLNSFVLLGVQIRGDWLGFGVGFLIWGLITRRMGRVLQVVGGATALLTFAYLIDFSMPAPAGRGGEISVRGTVGRVVAPLNPDLARTLSDDSEAFAGSVSWRTEWWNAIWESVNADTIHTLFGHAYGFPLGSLVPYLASHSAEIRTPHNVFYYALGYGGWIGVALFFSLQFAIVQLLWRSYKRSGQPFGLCYWGAALAAGFFGNFFESPFGAVPFYLLIGIASAAAVAPVRVTAVRPALRSYAPARSSYQRGGLAPPLRGRRGALGGSRAPQIRPSARPVP